MSENSAEQQGYSAPESGQAAQGSGSGAGVPTVRQAQFGEIVAGEPAGHQNPLDLVLDVEVRVSVELGRATLQVRDILELGPGSVVELDKLAGEPVEVLVNNKPYARGEVVVVDDYFGVRVSELLGQGERNCGVR